MRRRRSRWVVAVTGGEASYGSPKYLSLFAVGLGLSAFQTWETDFDEMLLPQILRGSAIMFCLLPPTRLALGHFPPERVASLAHPLTTATA